MPPVSSTQSVSHPSSTSSSVPCPVCLEQVSSGHVFTSDKCGHSVCVDCMRQHLRIIAFDTKEFPLPCPTCRASLEPAQCFDFVVNTEPPAHESGPTVSPRDLHAALNALVIEKGLMSNLRYCANASCQTPFEWVDSNLEQASQRFRVCCAECGQATCVQCRTIWHERFTCEENLQSNGNDNILSLAESRGWKPCPSCRYLIEKQQGDCAYVVCRCGCGFCHTCGKAYRSTNPTFLNAHGVPDCDCALFVEEDEAPDEIQPARVLEDPINEVARGLAIAAESDEDHYFPPNQADSDSDTISDDAQGVHDTMPGDEDHEQIGDDNLVFPPHIWSDSDDHAEDNFDENITSDTYPESNYDDLLEEIIDAFGDVLGRVSANPEDLFDVSGDQDESDVNLSDNDHFVSNNENSDVSDAEHLSQSEEPNLGIENNIYPSFEPEAQISGTDIAADVSGAHEIHPFYNVGEGEVVPDCYSDANSCRNNVSGEDVILGNSPVHDVGDRHLYHDDDEGDVTANEDDISRDYSEDGHSDNYVDGYDDFFGDDDYNDGFGSDGYDSGFDPDDYEGDYDVDDVGEDYDCGSWSD